jgi:iron complex outermembrane recepter protein
MEGHAQPAEDPPVVRSDTYVVQGAAPSDPILRAAQAHTDGAVPVDSAGWSNLAVQIPNLEVETAGPSSFGAVYSLRGLSNTPYFSDPSVTLYVDDIPLEGSFSYPTDVFGLGNASVYLGPQPAEFGRAGEGGVIVLTPDAPTGSGEIRAGVGSFNSRSASIEAAVSSGSSASTLATIALTQRDGYIENTQIGRTVDDLHALTAFTRQTLRPTMETEVSLEFLADRHHDGAAPLVPISGPLYSVAREQEGETDTALYGVALKASLETTAARFSETTSYTYGKIDPYADWLVLPPALLSDVTQSERSWNEELRLASPESSVLNWDFGSWISEVTTAGSTDRSIKGLIPIEVSGYGYTKHEAALFGEIVVLPLRGVRISFGARAAATHKDYHQEEQVPTPGLETHINRSFDVFLPKLAAMIDLGSSTEATASISEGSKPGGFAAYTDNPALIPFAAEFTTAFEAEIQHSIRAKVSILSVRVFDYEIRNYQIERSFTPTDYFVATAPRARSTGVETQIDWQPIKTLEVSFNMGLQEVSLLQFRDPITGQSYNGNRAPYAPSFTGALDLTYRGSCGGFVTVNCSAKGKAFYTESEDATFAQPSYALLGGRGGFESKRWRITAYVNNACNKGYYTLIVAGVKSAAPGAPRTYGTEVALKF